MFTRLLHRRRGSRLFVSDERLPEYLRWGTAGHSLAIFLLAACGLFLVPQQPCQAGCRGYIQFRALHGSSTAGLPLADPAAASSRGTSQVARVLPGPEVPCHGPECHAPPAQPSWPLAPVPSGLGAPSLEATLSHPSSLAALMRVSGILPLTSDCVARQTADRLERPPRS
ncbi:MAG: hypothetical protein ACKPEY_04360 [Planctomycetota bacterium]